MLQDTNFLFQQKQKRPPVKGGLLINIYLE